MKHPTLLYLALMTLCGGCRAEATHGSLAELSIIDRDTGAALTPYVYKGQYWVAGRPGARYAVDVRSHVGERLLVVMSVDGVNVVSGETAAWDQTGYVFHPGEAYQVTGWRKSDTEIAAFTFTDSPDSYAERTGRPANVGVIGVALFRERAPIAYSTQPPPVTTPAPEPRYYNGNAADNSIAAAPRAESLAEAPYARQTPAPEAKLGTGHGEREYSYIGHTDFVRAGSHPNEILTIHYDTRANLLAMGIIPRTHPTRPSTNPFPGSAESYVPDPPG